jgi:predicted Zn-dependent protease with MMP-like domain
VEQNDFQKLVKKAVSGLPENIRQKMDNVAICVEKRPSPEQLRKLGTRNSGILLGLYEGIPQTKWGKGFGMRLPDKITIFQESIERLAKTPEAIKKVVKNTVWHEIAHHFGFDEKGIHDLERKKKRG